MLQVGTPTGQKPEKLARGSTPDIELTIYLLNCILNMRKKESRQNRCKGCLQDDFVLDGNARFSCVNGKTASVMFVIIHC